MYFGSLLKLFRNLRVYTQAELGEKVGLNDVRIRQYESGARTPREDVRKSLAKALELKKSWFLCLQRFQDFCPLLPP